MVLRGMNSPCLNPITTRNLSTSPHWLKDSARQIAGGLLLWQSMDLLQTVRRLYRRSRLSRNLNMPIFRTPCRATTYEIHELPLEVVRLSMVVAVALYEIWTIRVAIQYETIST